MKLHGYTSVEDLGLHTVSTLAVPFLELSDLWAYVFLSYIKECV